MKHEGKKWRTNAGTSSYQNYANSAFVPCIPVFQSLLSLPYIYLTYPYISQYPLHIVHTFNLQSCRKKLAGERSIVVFFFFFFFFMFVCIKGYPSLAPKKENFMMESVETKIAWKKLCASRLHIKNLQSTSSLKDILRRRIEQKLVQ